MHTYVKREQSSIEHNIQSNNQSFNFKKGIYVQQSNRQKVPCMKSQPSRLASQYGICPLYNRKVSSSNQTQVVNLKSAIQQMDKGILGNIFKSIANNATDSTCFVAVCGCAVTSIL